MVSFGVSSKDTWVLIGVNCKMTIRDKETLKGYFNRGDVPTEENFADLIDSFFNAAELVLHASSHMYGGSDPIATFTPGAYLIPMAKADGKLDSTWFPQFKHDSLLNLGSDDHTQYVHISQSRTITAQHQFNPTSAIAPFTLGANARGQVVTGLRADELNKSVLAGEGLIGGGILTSDKTLSIDQDYSFNWTSQHIFNWPIMGAGIYPIHPDTYDIGNSDNLWRKGFFSELESLIFAKNTISIIGGWLMVSKGEGNFSSDVLSTDTYIDFGQTMTVNDFVIVRYNGEVEYIKVGSQVSGYVYNVTRDLDGTGAGKWSIGVPYVILGNTGNGRIELNATDTPRMSIIQQGSTYNSQTELIRIGDLNGGWGYFAETYGAAFGNYAGSGANVTIDPTNGVRLRRGSTDVIKLTSTEATFKSLIKMPDTGSALAIGVIPPISSGSGTGLWIDRTGFYSLNANIKQVWIDSTTGKLYAGGGELYIDYNGLHLPVNLNIESYGGGPTSIKWHSGIYGIYETTDIQAYVNSVGYKNTLLIESKFPWNPDSRPVGDRAGYGDIILKAWGTDDGILNAKTTMAVLSVNNFNLFTYGEDPYFSASGGALFGSGPEKPSNGEVVNNLSTIRTRTTIPVYNSGSNKIFSKASSLFSLSQDNIPVNLSSISSAGYLLPLNFYLFSALWKTGHDPIGTTNMAIDLGPNNLHLTRNNIPGVIQKGNPGSIVGTSFNGSNQYLSVPLSFPINHPFDCSFGAWVYLDSITRSHGIARAGSTTPNWQLIYYYGSPTSRYFEFGYWDTGNVYRSISTKLWNTIGWVYVGMTIRHGSSGDNTFSLVVNNNIQQVNNIAYTSPRTAVGDFELGRSGPTGTYYLLGKMTTAWMAGNPIQQHIDYYAATRGYYEY